VLTRREQCDAVNSEFALRRPRSLRIAEPRRSEIQSDRGFTFGHAQAFAAAPTALRAGSAWHWYAGTETKPSSSVESAPPRGSDQPTVRFERTLKSW